MLEPFGFKKICVMLMHFLNKEAKNYGISLTKKVRGKSVKLSKYELMSKIHKSQLRELLGLITLCKKLNIKPRFDVARKSPVRKSPVRKSPAVSYTHLRAHET